jgi:hypothetical protein
MRRTLVTSAAALVLVWATGVAVPSPVAAAPAPNEGKVEKLLCNEGSPICAETNDALGYEGTYTGHDEPSLLFYSNTPGSGNNQQSACRR